MKNLPMRGIIVDVERELSERIQQKLCLVCVLTLSDSFKIPPDHKLQKPGKSRKFVIAKHILEHD